LQKEIKKNKGKITFFSIFHILSFIVHSFIAFKFINFNIANNCVKLVEPRQKEITKQHILFSFIGQQIIMLQHR